jgi:protein-tyrosine phosphatase
LRSFGNIKIVITTIYSAKEDFLNAAKEQIEAEYGSVQTYLKKGIGLSAEEIEQLRSILLTDN